MWRRKNPLAGVAPQFDLPIDPDGFVRFVPLRPARRVDARSEGYYIDQDTTDAFLDAPELRYEGGLTHQERLEAEGYNLDDLSSLAEQIAERHGKPLRKLPPPTDH